MTFEQAVIHHERGEINEAIAIYDQLLNSNFFNIRVLFYYATALYQQGKHGLAANVFKQVIMQDPEQQAALQNLGNCFKVENKHKDAEEIYKMALSLGETDELYGNLGSLFINNGTPQKAIEYYEKGLKCNPNNDLIRFNMGLAYLELGQWQKGFEYYELGFKAGNRATRDYIGIKPWDGSEGKTLILFGEQGLGDEIMFASCLPDAVKMSKRVIFDCHPRLVDTFKRSFPDIEIHGTRKNQVLDWVKTTDADAYASITTMAMHVRKNDSDFPGKPYIKTDQEKVKELRKHGNGKLRVGISWAGGLKSTRKDLRSFALDTLIPVLKNDCDFYSLQYTPSAAREVCDLEEKHGVHIRHFPNLVESYNYDETINFIASMDLVITVCTTVHHAAGALGIPTWTLVPSGPAWRYGVDGESTVWYDSVKLCRQKDGETWTPVINKISEDLNALVRGIPQLEQKAA